MLFTPTPFIVPSSNFCLHISSLSFCHLFASFLHPPPPPRPPPELTQTRPAHSPHAALSIGRFHRDLTAPHADNMNVLSFLWPLFSDSGNKNVCAHSPPSLSLCTLSDAPCKQTVKAASSTRDSGKGGIFTVRAFQDLRRANRGPTLEVFSRNKYTKETRGGGRFIKRPPRGPDVRLHLSESHVSFSRRDCINKCPSHWICITVF